MTPVLEAIFGSRSAVQVLLFVEAYGSGHASRMATIYDVSVMGIQRQLKRFEAEGVMVSRSVGRTRVFEFNARLPTVHNLRGFLREELDQLPKSYIKQYYRQRQRPRRTGKEL
jgi:hypothetical protein